MGTVKFKKAEIQLKMEDGTVETASAMVFDDYAYHKSVDVDGNYTVSHISSGFRVCEFYGQKKARALVIRLAETKVKWDGKGKPSKVFKTTVQEAMEGTGVRA